VDAGSTQNVVMLCSMFCYIAGYQLGFGPVLFLNFFLWKSVARPSLLQSR
jgi:hypothetical protein